MSFRHIAIREIYPQTNLIDDGHGAFDANGMQIQIDETLVTAKTTELQAAEPMRLLRVERDRRIALTDWRFRSDLTPSQEWIDYCQALRDLPANSTPALDENGQLTGVNWPTPPEN